jgi:predicted ATP-grasp superfamily ATP-dependent carboligase
MYLRTGQSLFLDTIRTSVESAKMEAMRQSRAEAGETLQSVPVLVLGVGITALGVVRCLGRRGTPLYVTGTEEPLVSRSRWYRPLPGGPLREASPEALRARLEALPFERVVLLPCTDAWAAAVSGLAPDLAARFPASVSPPAVMKRFIDKGSFAEILDELGLPHPRTVILRDEETLAGVTDETLASSFLKPTRTRPFSEKYHAKAIRFRDREDVRRRIAETRGLAFELMLQEFISGPPSCHFFVEGFVDRRGNIPAILARQRVRMFPREFGNSTATLTIPIERIPSAADTIRRLLEGLGYRGVFSAEFKFDARDRLYKILEVNARPWWYVEFAASCGVDVCEMARLDALGKEVPPVAEYPAGRWCVYPRLDYKSLRLPGSGNGLWRVVRSWFDAEQLTLRSDDPAPGIQELYRWGATNLRRTLLW